ncbi:ABC transporter substrate-binding protein [Aeromonas salmonicida]|uniref:ABC transporter substrate-binding protein n=1 Tax=Aeromonas salmonicida TaxID=645 RepID=UPI001EE0FB0E|nr:ABC transporter substrate-binding protein [Aeromonas salmonicida]
MAKLLLLGQLTLMSWMVQAAAPVEVEDVLGRKVSLTLPAKRIVLGFYPEDYLAVAGEGGADRLVGMSRGWFVKSRPAIWSLYVASLPQLALVPDLGNVQDQSFSIEKTLAVRPDVVILAQWQYEALAPDLPRLEQAGIPVVVVDYNAQTLSRHMASTLLLGKVTGQEARARKMADEYKAKIETIRSRIAEAKRQPPRVYIELGDKGPAEYSYTYGKDMWGAMALLAGGDNVAAPFVERWGPIHPEQLLASKPEVILMAGYESVSSEQRAGHAGRSGYFGPDSACPPAGICRPPGLARSACHTTGPSLCGLSRRHPQHHGCRPHRVHGQGVLPRLVRRSRPPGHLSGLLPRLSAHSPAGHFYAGYQVMAG